MTDLYQNHQIEKLKKLATQSGIQESALVEKAGQFAFDVLVECFPRAQKIVVCVGQGSHVNAAFVLARIAKESDKKVCIYTTVGLAELSGSTKKAAAFAQQAGIEIKPITANTTFVGDVIVDAILAGGIEGDDEQQILEVIDKINHSSAEVLALDAPSGIDADTGNIQRGRSVIADVTTTLIAPKPGLYTRKGVACCGKIFCNSLGIPQKIYQKLTPYAETLTWEDVRRPLSDHLNQSSKKNSGHVLIVGGDYGMGGAVLVAAEAALRAGAGSVSIATRPEHVPVVNLSLPEISCFQVASSKELAPLLEQADVVVVGPGLGSSAWAEVLIDSILPCSIPKLLDADALGLLSQRIQRTDDWILTAHPGEAARLMQTSCQVLQEDRFRAVNDIQKQYGGVIVLKGTGTLIRGISGITKVCATSGSAMASGGTGDVLCGIIGSLLAQGLDLLAAAEAGVMVYAKSVELATEEKKQGNLLALDVLQHLQQLVSQK